MPRNKCKACAGPVLGAMFARLPIHVIHLILVGFLGGNAMDAMLRAAPPDLHAAIRLTDAGPVARAISARDSRARLIDAVVYDYEYARFVKFYLRIAEKNRAKLANMKEFDVAFIGDDAGFTGEAILVRKYPTSVVFAVLTPRLERAIEFGFCNTPSCLPRQYLVYSKPRVERMRYLYHNAVKSARLRAAAAAAAAEIRRCV
jgi:hypothetical protein